MNPTPNERSAQNERQEESSTLNFKVFGQELEERHRRLFQESFLLYLLLLVVIHFVWVIIFHKKKTREEVCLSFGKERRSSYSFNP